MKRIVFCIACMLPALEVTASERLNWHARYVDNVISERESFDDYRIKLEDVSFARQVIAGAQELSTKRSAKDMVSIESVIVAAIKALPGVTGDFSWGAPIASNGVVFWPNNDLVDINRVHYQPVQYPDPKPGDIILDISDPVGLPGGPTLSITRMREGYAPVGPDGQLVRLCQIVDGSPASYLEVSDSQAERLLKAAQSADSDVESACLPADIKSDHWRDRLKVAHGY